MKPVTNSRAPRHFDNFIDNVPLVHGVFSFMKSGDSPESGDLLGIVGYLALGGNYRENQPRLTASPVNPEPEYRLP